MADTSRPLTSARQDVVTLRDYTDMRFCALEKFINERFTAVERATAAAYEAQQIRLAAMNEIRDQLRAQADTFMTKDGVEACVAELKAAQRESNVNIQSLRESRAEIAGKASQQSVNISYLLAGISLLIGLFSLASKWL